MRIVTAKTLVYSVLVSVESTGGVAVEQTEVGSYFVANYPPFSVWTKEAVASAARPALAKPPAPGLPLGLYLHIPFCRKRCHFCYFRVYTDKNARDVAHYLDTLVREWELYLREPAIAGRELDFVYFGGGTPSFLSTAQLESLVGRLTALTPWANAEEITFECEPGTLTAGKLEAIRGMGVTRLSLGIENFDDRILEINGRAHRSAEIFTAYEKARTLGFPQVNIDLIAGMLGETDANWQACVEQDARAPAGQRHHLPDGAALQHHDQPGPDQGHAPSSRSPWRTGRPSGAGWPRRSRRSRPRATTSAAPTPPSRTRRGRTSSIATASGRAPTSSGSAWPRSGT